MINQDFYYKDVAKQNSVDGLSCIFQNLTSENIVKGMFELSYEQMIIFHNHMNSSNSWKSVSQWETGVKYKIFHPSGEITVSDINRGETSNMFRETIEKIIEGVTFDDTIKFKIERTRQVAIDSKNESFHISSYNRIRIESRKEFKYESERSSWIFGLYVLWEGETKEEAESSNKRYFVDVSYGSLEKASRDVKYTTASFLEKMMDALFNRSKKRHVFIDLS